MPKQSEEEFELSDEGVAAFEKLLAYLVTDECAQTVRTIRYIRERCEAACIPEKLKGYEPTANDDWEEGLVGLA